MEARSWPRQLDKTAPSGPFVVRMKSRSVENLSGIDFGAVKKVQSNGQ
jgi:hypothetical protein